MSAVAGESARRSSASSFARNLISGTRRASSTLAHEPAPETELDQETRLRIQQEAQAALVQDGLEILLIARRGWVNECKVLKSELEAWQAEASIDARIKERIARLEKRLKYAEEQLLGIDKELLEDYNVKQKSN